MFEGLMTFFASLGFGIIFDLRGTKLLVAALNGMIGGVVYNVILTNNSSTLSLFIASVVISIISGIMARILKCPTTTFLIAALIPLVPGGQMYYTVLDIINNDITAAVNDGLKTVVDACSIVIGCVFISGLELALNSLQRRYLNKHI